MNYKAIYNTHLNVVTIDGSIAYDANGHVVELNQQAVIDEEIRLQAEYEYKEYQRKRAAEYPSIQEQMDMQYWDLINGTTTWQDAIDAVKAKYPKPEVA
jgi:basic membrane lipoprotein Med (substrate-binding protein (PBP1-ABC) superfamily)